MVDIKQVAWKYALLNAAKYKGKASTGSVMSNIMGNEPELRPLARELKPIIDNAVCRVNALDPDGLAVQSELLGLPSVIRKEAKVEKGLPDLPKVAKPVFRLAPYPSGPLHIGNARMVVLNDEYAKRMNGKVVLCFDDTIGAMKKNIEEQGSGAKYVVPEAYNLIREGLTWLGVNWHEEFYKSDRLHIYYDFCTKLIKMNMAYACDCAPDVFRDLKNNGIPCPHHDRPIAETMSIWKGMLDKEYDEGEIVIRMKTGLDLKDPALREPVIMRISFATHPRVGTRYHVWPMLEFSWAIDDHAFGITHIIRGKDLFKEDFIEEYVWDLFGWPRKTILHYGIISFKGLKLSKTHAREQIQAGVYTGWDDPRTWSLQSLARRGFHPDALRATLLSMKLSMTDVDFPYTMLYSENMKIVNTITPRFTFIPDPVKITVQGVPWREKKINVVVNPVNRDMGTREIHLRSNGSKAIYVNSDDLDNFMVGNTVMFKDLFPATITRDHVIHGVQGATTRRRQPHLQWIDAGKSKAVNMTVLMPDGDVVHGKTEEAILSVREGTLVAFDNFGFARIDDVSCDGVVAWFAH